VIVGDLIFFSPISNFIFLLILDIPKDLVLVSDASVDSRATSLLATLVSIPLAVCGAGELLQN
jgi:hypothetical protein